MAGSLTRGLAVLKVLAEEIEGLPLNEIAERVDIPKAAAHRALAELTAEGFTRQAGLQGNYRLSLNFTSLALRHLHQYPLVTLARPSLQRLATLSRELVRVCVVEDGRLFWVDKRQGAQSGLRYDDPDMGAEVRLSKSATGIAWLSQLDDSAAKAAATGQDLGPGGGSLPEDEATFMGRLAAARRHGYAYVADIYAPGLAALAAPIVPPGQSVATGVISIAGPSARLTEAEAARLAPALLSEVHDVAGLMAGVGSEPVVALHA